MIGWPYGVWEGGWGVFEKIDAAIRDRRSAGRGFYKVLLIKA
jgi:hypothetical protein